MINLNKFSKIINDSDQYIQKKCAELICELNKIYKKLSKLPDKEFLIEFYTYCVVIEKSSIYFKKYNKYTRQEIETLIAQYEELQDRFLELLKDHVDPVQSKVGYSRYKEKLKNLII